jgi:AcrR family transcriptional regulator
MSTTSLESAPKDGLRARQAEETRGALVRCARRLFAEKGYHATGTHEIVQAANVTRGALAHHFAHKRDLFVAVLDEVQRDLSQPALDRAGGPRNRWERLLAQLDPFLQAAKASEVQRILLLDGPAVLGWDEWRRREAKYGLGIIRGAIEDGIAAGRVRPQPTEVLAHLLLSMIHEAALLVANAADPEATAAEATSSLRRLFSNL